MYIYEGHQVTGYYHSSILSTRDAESLFFVGLRLHRVRQFRTPDSERRRETALQGAL